MEKTDRGLQIKYSMAQGGYWLVAAVLGVFVTPILLYKGFNEYEIGTLTAVKSLATCVFQIFIAGFADRYAHKIQLKNIIAGLLLVGIFSSFLFYILDSNYVVALLLFILMGIGITCTGPLIDSLAAVYMNSGLFVDYTSARACGSATWAFASLGFGVFCSVFGTENLLLLQVIFLLFLLIVIFLLNRTPSKEQASATVNQEDEGVHSLLWILFHYKKYSIFLIGAFLMALCFNTGSCFLIKAFERVGGSETHLGIANFVLAIAEIPSVFIFYRLRKIMSLDRIFVIVALFNTVKSMGLLIGINVYILIGFQIFEMLGYGLSYSANVSYVMELLPSQDVVKGVSFIGTVTSGIGAAAGFYLAGAIISHYGLVKLEIFSVLCGLLSTIVMILNDHEKESYLCPLKNYI